jgi:carbon-monoxide dehydrogenase large subunit
MSATPVQGQVARFGASQAPLRVEDERLLLGRGRYADDVELPGQAHAAVLRSPMAHARIVRLDAARARAAPGVLAVYAAADLAAEGLGPLPCIIPLGNRDGSPRADPPRLSLAADRVRHVGDPVAFVVADSQARARDAVELIDIEYEALPAAVGAVRALEPGAPLVWDDVPGNLCFDWEAGDAAATAEWMARAARVVTIDLVNNRVAPSPMEPRAANASFDPAAGRWTMQVGTQGTHLVRAQLAAIFGLPEDRFHVLTPDVGGGFGMKLYMYPEYVLCAFAARRLGRPVKWAADRSESLLSDTQGRDHVTRAELALDAEGTMLALRVRTVADMGAYLSTFAPLIPTQVSAQVMPSVYRMQAMHASVRGAFTHTVPVDAYRGAGRPEAHYIVERLIDKAARELGIDRIEIRRRNLVPADAMPWRNLLGITYDSGDFAAVLASAARLCDWEGFAARKAAAARAGRLRGIGLACYIEATGGGPSERAEIRFTAGGEVEVLVGTQSSGQGHETAYTQIVARELGVPAGRVRIVQGDSDRIASGGGTGGSRSLYSEGGALLRTAQTVIARGRDAAAREFECAAGDVEFAGGVFRVAGTDRAVALLELAAKTRLPAGSALDAAEVFTLAAHTFPNGCHTAEVEIDPDTGRLRLLRYGVVDDFGNVINPAIVAGQVAGGAVQGAGQAMFEAVRYDEDGQLQTGSLMDYCLPRADDVPDIEVLLQGTPCTTNPLGVKGAGEAGAIGAPPAIVNAVLDALAGTGVQSIDMPLTPERIWRALRGAAA